MKKLRSILSMFLVAAMVISISACGQNGDSGVKGKNSGSNNAVNSDIISSIPSELKGTTIKYFMWYDGRKETEGPVINSFELESGIKVDVEVGSYSDFNTELAGKVASNNSPDVIRMGGPAINVLKFLQPISNTGYDFSGSEWDQQTMKDYTVNGNVYGVNLKNTVYFDTHVIWYNYQTLSDLGVDDPYTTWKKNEWTWDSLWNICREFVKQGGNYGACFSPVNIVSLSYGVNFVDLENGQYVNSITDSARNAKLVKAWAELIDKKQEKLLTPNTWLIADFDAGRSAFFSTSISSGFVKRSYFEQFKNNGELRCVPLPASYSGESSLIMSEYSAWGIPKGAKNAKAVPYFLRYMLDDSNYDLDEAFADSSILDVFKTLRDSDAPRYCNVMTQILTEADSGLNYFQMYDKLFSGEVSQISSTLQSFKGGVQDAVDKANEQIKAMG